MVDGTARIGPGTGMLGTDPGGDLVLRRVLVRVVSGPDSGKSVTLEAGTLIIGSHPDADLTLTEPSVSRYHAELALLHEGIRVRDLRSTNGTFVGDSRIESAIVATGSEVRLGRARLEILPADLPIPAAPSDRMRFGGLVGASPPMRRLYGQLERIAASDAPVLIFGEAGTGKSEAARAVHDASSRRSGPFGELSLRAGLPPTGIADEMQRTTAGTIILDHVDEMPSQLQDSLSVVLDRLERRLYDVRVVALARSDLRDLVERGTFRRDLFFSLASVRVEIPPLRDRLEDLPRLVAELVRTTGYPDVGLTRAELGSLRGHDFSGNVRELRRMIEETLLSSERASNPPQPPSEDAVPITEDLVQLPFKQAKERLLDAFERRYLQTLLDKHAGNVSRAAGEAGVDRNHLARLAKKHGLR